MSAPVDPRYQFVLQAVYDHFREHASWPLVRKLELDLEDRLDPLGGLQLVCIAIGSDKIVCGSSYSESDVCRLRLAGFAQCDGAEPDIDRFLKVIRYCARRYREAEGRPVTVSAAEFVAELDLTEDEARRAGVMLEDSGIWSSATRPQGDWATFTLSPLAAKMRDVKALDDFLQRRALEDARQWDAALARFRREAPARANVFLSHAAVDRPLAEVVREQLNHFDVFMASKPGHIRPGQEWLDAVFEKLKNAGYYMVLLTPNSMDRPWVWFESGAAWMSGRPLIPVVAGGLSVGEVPYPLAAWQVLSLENPDEAVEVFRELGVALPNREAFAERVRMIGREAVTAGLQDGGWQMVEVGGRRFAWAGPLYELADRNPTYASRELYQELERAGLGMYHSTRQRLGKHIAEGWLQVFETNCKNWKREVLSNNEAILIVRPPTAQ